jgi:cell wall-associated NlpC family hydrolase
MVVSPSLSKIIVNIAVSHVGRPYEHQVFDCVSFFLEVYSAAGIKLPSSVVLNGHINPPDEFNLSSDEFVKMPLGHSVFFKRKISTSDRIWTHIAIIMSHDELIHCSGYFGRRVVVTPKDQFMEIYSLVPRTDPT